MHCGSQPHSWKVQLVSGSLQAQRWKYHQSDCWSCRLGKEKLVCRRSMVLLSHRLIP